MEKLTVKASHVAITLLLVAIAAVAIYFMKIKEPAATEDQPRTPEFVINDTKASNERIVIESEDFTEIEAPFSKISVADIPESPVKDASKGKAIYLGPEKINEKPEIAKNKKGHPDAKHPGYVKYMLTPKTGGDYNLWLRVYWTDDCADSISVSIGPSPLLTVQSADHKKWIWLPLRDGKGKPLNLTLEGGKSYPLTLCNREDGLFIDQIILQKPTDPKPTSIAK